MIKKWYVDEQYSDDGKYTYLSFVLLDDQQIKDLITRIKKVIKKRETNKKQLSVLLTELKVNKLKNKSYIEEIIDVLTVIKDHSIICIDGQPGDKTFKANYNYALKKMNKHIVVIDVIGSVNYTNQIILNLENVSQCDSRLCLGIQIADLLFLLKPKNYV